MLSCLPDRDGTQVGNVCIPLAHGVGPHRPASPTLHSSAIVNVLAAQPWCWDAAKYPALCPPARLPAYRIDDAVATDR